MDNRPPRFRTGAASRLEGRLGAAAPMFLHPPACPPPKARAGRATARNEPPEGLRAQVAAGGEGLARAWDKAVERVSSASLERLRPSQTSMGLMRVLNRLDKEAEKISIDTSKAGLRDLLERGYGDGS